MAFKQGWYKPKHPEKYVGNIHKIRYMSSWEYDMDKMLDNNPNILQWSSEPFAIPYIKPTDKRVHRYYPDYWVKFRNRKGEIVQEVWEVKPAYQTRPTRSKNNRRRIVEQVTYAVNLAKWEAAQKYCDKYGMKFRTITEKELFR